MNVALLEELPESGRPDKIGRASVVSLLSPEHKTKTIQLWLTFFFCFITLYFLMSWVRKLVVLAGMSEVDGVYGATVFNGGGVAGPFIGGIFIAQGLSMTENFLLFALPTSMAGVLAWRLNVR